jgi:hypothetical protein
MRLSDMPWIGQLSNGYMVWRLRLQSSFGRQLRAANSPVSWNRRILSVRMYQ